MDSPRPARKKPRADYVPGEVVVRFRGEDPPALGRAAKGGALALRASSGREIVARLERLDADEPAPDLLLARVEAADTMAAVAALRSRPDVVYAEPNYKRYSSRAPNDQRFPDLWGLREAGSEHLFEGATAHGVDAERAWDITTGDRRVVVGVVDEGINVFHPDLAANAWRNPGETPGNGIDDDGNGFTDDVHGWDFFHNDSSVYDGRDDHGTHVAGTIGAVGDNGLGVVGVNWQVSLMSLKVLGQSGEASSVTSIAYTIRAFNYARRMREMWESSGGARGANVRVLNNSYGGFDDSAAEAEAVRALGEAGILFVAAAGNEGRSSDTFPTFPAGYDAPNVIAVAGGGTRDNLLNYSNYGAQKVHLSAPGFHVLSTTGADYGFLSGTSMASPHVAGAAALICAARSDVTVGALRDLLLLNGDVLPAHEGSTMTRRRLNAHKSLRAAAENDATPPARINDLRLVSQEGRRLTLAWTSPGDDGGRTGSAALYELRFTPARPASESDFDAGVPLYAPLPEGPRTAQGAHVTLPLRHTEGYVSVRAVDNVGNRGEVASLHVSVGLDEADPYLVTDSDPQPLSSGGTRLHNRDDGTRQEHPLPFAFPIFGRWVTHLDVSPNGALYFELPPDYRLPPKTYRGVDIDAEPTTRALNRYFMIAPMWDDIRLDRGAGQPGLWEVRPDPDRVIFRWEGVTFNTPLDTGQTRGEHPVSFEVELRRDGRIQMRYGDGNTRLFPIVGISGGTPDSDAGYVIASHTSEHFLKDLTRARTLTFTPRRTPPPASSDLRVRVENATDRVAEGGRVNYTFLVETLGPDSAGGVRFSYTLPQGTTFVSHSTYDPNPSEITCVVPAVGSHGTVNCQMGRVGEFYYRRIKSVSVTLQTHAPAGSVLTGTATVAHSSPDPSSANNSAETASVIASYAALRDVATIAPGFALLRDGTLWHWGRRLGTVFDRDYDVSPVRVDISGVSSVASAFVSEGAGHAVALKGDGTVWTWGLNTAGQLGMGKSENELRGLTRPTQVPGLTSVVAVAAGPFQSIALKADGTVWSWGSVGGWSSLSPAQVPDLAGVVSVAAGGGNFAAVKADGSLWMWGSNFDGLLNDGTTRDSAVPVRVNGVADVTSVSIARTYALALRRDGSVWSWGRNSGGQLGDGTFNDRTAPGPVSNLSGVTSVSAGDGGSLALKADGSVWAWPPHLYGPPPSFPLPPPVPARLDDLMPSVAVASSSGHNFYVLLADGTIRAWGGNDFGQVGDGTTEHRRTASVVRMLAAVHAPVFQPGGRSFIVPGRVTITCPTEGAVIRYTTDGREPTEADPILPAGAAVPVSQDLTLKAKAWKTGWTPSLVATASYKVGTVSNLIDTTHFYVNQHYQDFLGREPDGGGLQFWADVIEGCGADHSCRRVRRVNVSAAFFLSIEFQETGYLVYRLYKAAYGDMPGRPVPVRREEFLPDAREISRGVVVGVGEWQRRLETNKEVFARQFVARQQFLSEYPAGMTAAEFVDKLNRNAGGALSPAERDALVAEMGDSPADAARRAVVLRRVAEDSDLRQVEFNKAFVLMQYFGYLRRNPDDAPDPDYSGWQFWLNQLNRFGGDFQRAEMVRAFIESIEYRQRFGQ